MEPMPDGNMISTETVSWFRSEVTLGNLLIILGMMGTLGAGIWQGGMIRATMEDGIRSERDMRQVEMTALVGRVDGVQNDVRELRAVVLRGRMIP